MRDESKSIPPQAQPAAPPRRNRMQNGLGRHRVVAAGAVAACLLGAVLGLALPKSFRGAPATQPQAQPQAQVQAPTAASAAQFQPISGPYAPVDRGRVESAYREAARLAAEQGLSGLARASMGCFERLSREPSYGLMDYCLALDAYGARAYEAAAGDAAPASTYFGQGPVRRQQAVQQLTAGQTDANARLLDTNRMIAAVAEGGAPTIQQAAAEPAPAVRPPPLSPPPPAPAAEPKLEPRPPKLAEPPRTADPQPPVLAEDERPEPAPTFAPPPRTRRYASGVPAADDCGYARTRGERMVCSEPALARADRRLANAFRRAMQETDDPRRLIEDQNRWLALRDRLAPDYEAVMSLYEDRIAELRRGDY